jgi:hypothetical protein
MIQEAINRANVAGVEFIKMWLANVDILGIEEPIDERREFFIVYRNGDGSRSVACIPLAGDSAKPCFFGSLDHFAMVAARQGSKYINERVALWHDDEVKHKYKNIISRYK